MKSMLLILFVLLSIISCDPAVSFIESIDGPDGLALKISPITTQLVITDSIDFTAQGGVPPYNYNIQSGTGLIDTDTGEYTAPGISGSALVKVEDSYGAISTASVEIVLPPDYIVNFAPAEGAVLVDSTISESFTIENQGSHNGHFHIYWTAYISTDSTLGVGTDYVIDSGSISELDIGEISPGVNFSGAWFVPAEDYHLIIDISADDDIYTGNNESSSSVYTVIAPDIDYEMTFNPLITPVTQYSNITGSFTIENNGVNSGSDTIYWTAYISTESTLGSGTDYPIDTGNSSALISGGSLIVPFVGIWYPAPGDYYLIIRAVVNDDVNLSNNAAASGVYTLIP